MILNVGTDVQSNNQTLFLKAKNSIFWLYLVREHPVFETSVSDIDLVVKLPSGAGHGHVTGQVVKRGHVGHLRKNNEILYHIMFAKIFSGCISLYCLTFLKMCLFRYTDWINFLRLFGFGLGPILILLKLPEK